MLTAPLRSYAKLEKRSLLVGQGKKFEIWNESIWNDKREVWLQDEEVKAQLPDDLMDLSIRSINYSSLPCFLLLIRS